MLWNMAEVDGALNLLEEMGVMPASSTRSAQKPGIVGGSR